MLSDEETVVLDCLMESSSDSEDEIILYGEFLDGERIPKIKNYIVDVVQQYNDDTFQKFFRMNRCSCYELIATFADSPFSLNRRGIGRNGHTAEEHILLFLRFAGDKVPLRVVSELFNVAVSVAHSMVQQVTDFLNDLAPAVITFPASAEDRQQLADEFLEIGNIDGIVGAIDGTYILIRTPEHKISSTYANRHDEPSLTLQAVCDVKYKFIDCFTGVSGKLHDARTYALSFVKTKAEQMGREYHLIGDAAYPLSVNLLTPYKNYGNMTPEQTRYNEHFSRCRVKIENAFALLKGRFRQLLRVEMATVDNISKFIIGCCVIHNLCIDNGDVREEYRDYDEFYVEPDEHVQENRRERYLGALKRDEVASLL